MSIAWESLFSKNGLAAREIAKELIYVKEGERISRVADFSRRLSIGRGTVQQGLKVLESLRALCLESRGHLGTFLIYKNVYLLKEIAGAGAFVGAMPLPYSSHYEGLATGLIEVSESMMEQVNMVYMRGSRQRLEGLRSRRHDFAVMSRLAAEEEIKQDDQLEVIADFGPKSFVTSHKIFLADPSNNGLKDGMKIGIDYSSIDQSFITLLECKGFNIELIPMTYMQVFNNLQNGSLDAAVWNTDEKRVSETFKKVDFETQEAKNVEKKASVAVILIEKGRKDVKKYFNQLDKQKVTKIQQLVIDKEKLPQY